MSREVSASRGGRSCVGEDPGAGICSEQLMKKADKIQQLRTAIAIHYATPSSSPTPAIHVNRTRIFLDMVFILKESEASMHKVLFFRQPYKKLSQKYI
jgi:hypothetical protein